MGEKDDQRGKHSGSDKRKNSSSLETPVQGMPSNGKENKIHHRIHQLLSHYCEIRQALK